MHHGIFVAGAESLSQVSSDVIDLETDPSRPEEHATLSHRERL
jgi:hypothetical protein